MLLVHMTIRFAVFISWLFTGLSNCQAGGSYGYAFDANKNCDVYSPLTWTYYGCFDMGSGNQTQHANHGSTFSQAPGGYTSGGLYMTNSGGQGFPGLYVAGTHYWTTSETPYNCTLLCRSHGFRITYLNMGTCQCAHLITSVSRTWNQNGVSRFDNYQNAYGADSGCTNAKGPTYPSAPSIYCYGDHSQTSCGWRTSYYGLDGFNYNDTINGVNHYMVGMYSDNTHSDPYKVSSQLLAGRFTYAYLGCFYFPNGPGRSLLPETPFSINATEPSLLNCWTLCARDGYALLSMTATTGPGGNITCACGVSFSLGTFQSLPDEPGNSQCLTNCVTQQKDGSCTHGTNCCGSGLYHAVYRSPNYVGCYEPPFPGTQIGSQTYPAACFKTIGTSTLTTGRKFSVTSTGLRTLATAPNSHPWGFVDYPQYNYLGCYRTGSLSLTNQSTAGMTGIGKPMQRLEDCMDYCKFSGGNGTLFAAATSLYSAGGMLCLCGNNMQFTDKMLPAYNCTNERCGSALGWPAPGQAYGQLCGGIDDWISPGTGNIGLYGPASELSHLPTRSIATFSTWTCIAPSTSSSPSSASSTVSSIDSSTMGSSTIVITSSLRLSSSSSSSIISSSLGLSSSSVLSSSSSSVSSSSSSASSTGALSSTRVIPESSTAILSSTRVTPESSTLLLSSTRPIPESSTVLLSSTRPAPESSTAPLSSTRPIPESSTILLSSTRPALESSTALLSSTRPVPASSTALLSSTKAQVPASSTAILSSTRPDQIPESSTVELAGVSSSQVGILSSTRLQERDIPSSTRPQEEISTAATLAATSPAAAVTSPEFVTAQLQSSTKQVGAVSSLAVGVSTPGAAVASSAIAPSSISALPAISTSLIILQVVPIGPGKLRRQAMNFLTPGSPSAQTSCDGSYTFSIQGGQLSSQDGNYLSTSNGVTWMTFQTSPTLLPINTQFTMDSNGYLIWSNAAFVGTRALFCEEPSGEIEVLFQGASDPLDLTYPAYGTTCVPIQLQLVGSSICYNTTIPLTTGGANTVAAPSGTCPMYPNTWYTVSPTGVSCVPHTLTWDQFGCTPSPAPFY